MRRGLIALIVLAVLSAASVSGVLLSGAVFNNSVTNAQGASSAADFVAPTATTAVIARDNANKPGYIQPSANYFVYANVTDSGNPPDPGAMTVTANLSNVTTGATSVALAACTTDCSVNGVPYGFKSAIKAADSSPGLTEGPKQFSLTTTDGAGNTRSGQSFSVTIDDTDPSVSTVIGADGSNTPGYVHPNGGYYLFANVSDTPNPASAIDTVTGNASAITTGATNVTMNPCTGAGCSIGGTTYAYKSDLLTEDSGLLDGATPGFDVTAADIAGNTDNDPHTATVDNTPPSVSAVTIQKETGGTEGFVSTSATNTGNHNHYFVYANASDDRAVDSVTANVSSVTTGATAIPLAAGSFTVNGTSYGYRSALQTANGSDGGTSFSVTATDGAGGTNTNSGGSVTVDSTAVTGTGYAAANAGATPSQPEASDTITLTTNKLLDPLIVFGGAPSTGVVKLHQASGKAHVLFFASNGTTRLPLGDVGTGGTYIGTGNPADAVFSATVAQASSGPFTITFTLGSLTSGATAQDLGSHGFSWGTNSGSGTATDRAGNQLTNTFTGTAAQF